MVKQTAVGFRLPTSLVEDLDRFAEKLSRQTGVNVSRTDAVKVLLNNGLRKAGKRRRPLARGAA